MKLLKSFLSNFLHYNYCQIWPNDHWNRIEWTQNMLLNTHRDIRTCQDKGKSKLMITFSLPIVFRGILELSLRSFFSAKIIFSFFLKFRFNIEIASYQHCWLRKHLKIGSETRSHIFLIKKTREKNPMSGFILISGITSENDLIVG